MTTTNQVTPMELIRPAANGLIALAMVSAMASMMVMATSTTVGAAGIHTMGSFIPYTGGSKKKQPTGVSSSSSDEELEDLNGRISRLRYVMENQAEALNGRRAYRDDLMRQYGLYVLPSMVELNKYPQLRSVNHLLTQGEKNYDRMELSMMFLQKRRKDKQIQLGLRNAEAERKKTYTVMKKPDTMVRDIYGRPKKER
ncbi:hypothetical protein MUP59_05730 [Candidatus Bathyarchaeota archaeon]|nr:hypothetical protein [Candidatus Bathyarchaeota archaeon]